MVRVWKIQRKAIADSRVQSEQVLWSVVELTSGEVEHVEWQMLSYAFYEIDQLERGEQGQKHSG